MSNPYLPNTASIPNIIFDYWMARLSPGEFKVLMAIARKTYGWRKPIDKISLRQLVELTGLHKSGVIKATEHLVSLGLVLKFKSSDEYGDLPNQYEINVECEREGEENNGGGSLPSRQGGVDCVDTGESTESTHKTHYTKPTKQNVVREGAKTHPVCENESGPSTYRSRAPEVFTKPSLTGGEPIACDKNLFYRRAMKKNPTASAQILEEAWDILYECTNPIRDYQLYLEGIVNKLLENPCNPTLNQEPKTSSKEKSEESKEIITDRNTRVPHWLKPAFDLETLRRLNAI